MAVAFNLTFLIFCLIGANASLRAEDSPYDKAMQAHAQAFYEKSNEILEEAHKKMDEAPNNVVELRALNLELMGQFNKALDDYTALIKKNFSAENEKTIKAYKKGEKKISSVPDKLLFYYYKRGQLYSQLYQRDYYKISAKERKTYKDRSEIYTKICQSANYNEEYTADIASKQQSFEELVEQKSYKTSWFISGALISWKDQVQMDSNSGSDIVKLDSAVMGQALGLGMRVHSNFYEMVWELQMILAKASMGEKEALINYSQNNVSVGGYLLGIGLLYRPTGEKIAFGVHPTVMYRTGNYQAPNGYFFPEKTLIQPGYFVEGKWEFSWIDLVLKFGSVSDMPSSVWLIQANYNF